MRLMMRVESKSSFYFINLMNFQLDKLDELYKLTSNFGADNIFSPASR